MEIPKRAGACPIYCMYSQSRRDLPYLQVNLYVEARKDPSINALGGLEVTRLEHKF